MPLYYFCLENGHSVEAEDPEDLRDDAAAIELCETVAKEMAGGREVGSGRCVVVSNADGIEIHRTYLTPSKDS